MYVSPNSTSDQGLGTLITVQYEVDVLDCSQCFRSVFSIVEIDVDEDGIVIIT